MQRFPRCLLALTFPLHSPSHFPPISQNSNSQELTLFCGFGAQVTSVTLTAFKIKSKLLSLTYKALNHPALAYLLSCNSLKHTPSCGIFLLLYLLYVFLEDYPSSPSGPTYSSVKLTSRVMSSENPCLYPILGYLLFLYVSVPLSSHNKISL